MPAKQLGVADVRGQWEGESPVIFLLDINVLIALTDPIHTFHARAQAWFGSVGRLAWATCPLTENGVLRIVGHPRYPKGIGSPFGVASLLARSCASPEHRFWADDISLLDDNLVDRQQLLSSHQLTDTYLLALAVKHGGKLATFDQRLLTTAVKGGDAALYIIE